MSKRKTEKLCEDIQRVAEHVSEGDDALSPQEVQDHLRATDVNPGELRARFHLAAKQMAERERLANRPVPLQLKQAIDASRPGDQMPNDPGLAGAFAKRWLEKFWSPFALPNGIETVRSYRKAGDISESDAAELDRLEAQLKRKAKGK